MEVNSFLYKYFDGYGAVEEEEMRFVFLRVDVISR